MRSLRELIIYGLMGLFAYSKRANTLLQDDPEVDAFIQHAPAKKLDGRMTVDELTALTIETGKFSVAGIGTVEDDLRLFFRD